MLAPVCPHSCLAKAPSEWLGLTSLHGQIFGADKWLGRRFTDQRVACTDGAVLETL